MPIYRVCSGELDMTLTRGTAQDAAKDAVRTLQTKSLKLGLLTSVLEVGSDEIPIFIETFHLVKIAGLNYSNPNSKGDS